MYNLINYFMKPFYIFLFFIGVLLSSCRQDYDDRCLIVNENPSETLLKKFEFDNNEFIDSYCAFLSDDDIILAWETNRKVYLVSVTEDAEVLGIAPDWALVRFSNDRILTLILDRRLLTEKQLRQLETILEDDARKIISGEDIAPYEIEEHIGNKIWILRPDWKVETPQITPNPMLEI